MRTNLLIIFCGVMFLGSGVSLAEGASARITDKISFGSFPPLGKWMIDKDLNVAHWLNRPFRNKEMDEPINIIIRVNADNAIEASKKLFKSTLLAGFPERKYHSTGYQAYIGDNLASQISNAKSSAFSDRNYLEDNNHGRIFGPVPFTDKQTNKIYYLFIGAFSREHAAPIKKAEHPDKTSFHVYSSFNRARDTFADQMEHMAGARFSGFVPLENAIHDDGDQTTGDHDGIAIWMDL